MGKKKKEKVVKKNITQTMYKKFAAILLSFACQIIKGINKKETNPKASRKYYFVILRIIDFRFEKIM